MEVLTHNETDQIQKPENQEDVSEGRTVPSDRVDPAIASIDRPNMPSNPTLLIELIIVEDRHRTDLGDLSDLKDSINKVGLLHPIVVTADRKLVAGQRRLEAFKELGRAEIPVHFIDLESLVQAEYDENVVRLPFSPIEAYNITEALTPIEQEKAKERKEASRRRKQVDSASGQHSETAGGKLPPGECGKTRDKVATATGYSATSLRKVKEIVAAAKDDPESYAQLLSKLKERKPIEPVYKEFISIRESQSSSDDNSTRPASSEEFTGTALTQDSNERTESNPENHDPDRNVKSNSRPSSKSKSRFSSVPNPTGCELILVNAPWERGHPSSVSPMSIDEIAQLPVRDMAGENCILWLRTPSVHFADAYAALKSWGFDGQDVLTWIKPQPESGDWLWNQTEHFILATRGNPSVDREKQPTSALPDAKDDGTGSPSALYELLEDFCPTKSRVEIFAQTTRSGWSSWPTGYQKPISETQPNPKGVDSSEITILSEVESESSETTMNPVDQDVLETEVWLIVESAQGVGSKEHSPETFTSELKALDTLQYLLPAGSSEGQFELVSNEEANRVINMRKGNRCDSDGIKVGENEHLADPQSSSLEETAQEPEQFTLVMTHSNGQEQKKTLSEDKVPDPEDWLSFTDQQWELNEKSKDGPLLSVRIEDGQGQEFFNTIEY